MTGGNGPDGAGNPLEVMANEGTIQATMQRIDVLIRTLDGLAAPATKECARELVQALLDAHGMGLARVLRIITQSGDPGVAIVKSLARDQLVSSLLLLHGLHPVDFAT